VLNSKSVEQAEIQIAREKYHGRLSNELLIDAIGHDNLSGVRINHVILIPA